MVPTVARDESELRKNKSSCLHFGLPYLFNSSNYYASTSIYLGVLLLCAGLVLPCKISSTKVTLQVLFVIEVEEKLELHFSIFTMIGRLTSYTCGPTAYAWEPNLKGKILKNFFGNTYSTPPGDISVLTGDKCV